MAIATALGYTIRGLDDVRKGSDRIRRVSKIHSQTGHVLSLDLLLVTPGIRQVWDSRVEADWEGGILSVVSREGLISLKRIRASPQDLADILALQEDIDDATDRYVSRGGDRATQACVATPTTLSVTGNS